MFCHQTQTKNWIERFCFSAQVSVEHWRHCGGLQIPLFIGRGILGAETRLQLLWTFLQVSETVRTLRAFQKRSQRSLGENPVGQRKRQGGKTCRKAIKLKTIPEAMLSPLTEFCQPKVLTFSGTEDCKERSTIRQRKSDEWWYILLPCVTVFGEYYCELRICLIHKSVGCNNNNNKIFLFRGWTCADDSAFLQEYAKKLTSTVDVLYDMEPVEQPKDSSALCDCHRPEMVNENCLLSTCLNARTEEKLVRSRNERLVAVFFVGHKARWTLTKALNKLPQRIQHITHELRLDKQVGVAVNIDSFCWVHIYYWGFLCVGTQGHVSLGIACRGATLWKNIRRVCCYCEYHWR